MVAPFLFIAVGALSIMFGAKEVTFQTFIETFTHFDASNPDHQIVMHARLPRTIGSCLIGAFLAISGALMQGMTRNYLASPSIMGVSDGSVFFITLGMVFYPEASTLELIFLSLAGSAFGVAVVFGLGSLLPHGLSPVRLAILGTIVGTFLSSLASAFAIYFKTSQNISFWYNARLHQLDPSMIKLAIPFAVIGLALAIYLSKSITILSLGDQVATGLGEKAARVKWLTILTVAILTGVSVAIAGKVAFVGLLIPHITRYLTGSDYRLVIPCAGILGGIFLLSADFISRFLNSPFETPISVVTSFIGVPFFIYLIKRNGGKAHV
ncbi:iron ABC transporter permease [Lentibacillus sp. N15]